MNVRRIIYVLLSGAGGGLIGVFSGRLDTVYGTILFTLGVALLVFGIIRSAKE